MIRTALLWFVVGMQPLWAEDLPALYAVTGVASDDVLNIRLAPDASSEILGGLAPDASGIEVIQIADGWATVNTDESVGFVAARFLRPMAEAPWHQLQQPLFCGGTEPFWSFEIDPLSQTASFQTPELQTPASLQLDELWPGSEWSPSVAVGFDLGLAVVQREICSDHMSERLYGLQIDIFLNGTEGQRFSGCCLLASD